MPVTSLSLLPELNEAGWSVKFGLVLLWNDHLFFVLRPVWEGFLSRGAEPNPLKSSQSSSENSDIVGDMLYF